MIGRLVLVALLVAGAAWHRRGRPRTVPAGPLETPQERRARIYGGLKPIWGREIMEQQGGVYWPPGSEQVVYRPVLRVEDVWDSPRGRKVRFAR